MSKHARQSFRRAISTESRKLSSLCMLIIDRCRVWATECRWKQTFHEPYASGRRAQKKWNVHLFLFFWWNWWIVDSPTSQIFLMKILHGWFALCLRLMYYFFFLLVCREGSLNAPTVAAEGALVKRLGSLCLRLNQDQSCTFCQVIVSLSPVVR